MIHRAIFSSHSLRAVTIAAALVVLTIPARVDAQTVATMFKKAQAQEDALAEDRSGDRGPSSCGQRV